MGLLDRLVPAPPPAGVTCEKYIARPGTKRCQHYLDGGACALTDEFMCVEWLKVNGHAAPPTAAARSLPVVAPAEPQPPVARDLLGEPVRAESKPAPKRPAARDPEPPVPDEASTPLDPIPEEDLASFKALGAELRFESESLGEVWLVPGYTGKDRKEISVDHAATLRLLVGAFPGCRVTAFQKLEPAPAPTAKEIP